MIYKVFFQQNPTEAPVRENTESLYIEASAVFEVRRKLIDKPYNIEFIQVVDGAYLEYEKQSENYKVLEI
ncbi:DNA-dependent RNA polymerase subunit epsilon [Sutcliffiella deserti]|uniref:DNA-dependent RNA polymerase subunit epsilon n=1 Tax=Sutcliffiella deserti TaxID=2875501 RepID=UPI001CBC5634|nr:DNA-directed RNA polymerase subunit epsilon [Sutcliffiella deserti]